MLLHTAAWNSYVYEKIWFLHSLFVSVQNDSLAALKKARHQYFQRCEELEKAKAISAKSIDDAAGFKTLDKRRKSKDEAQNKVGVPSNRVPGFKNELFSICLIPLCVSIRWWRRSSSTGSVWATQSSSRTSWWRSRRESSPTFASSSARETLCSRRWVCNREQWLDWTSLGRCCRFHIAR